MRAAREQILNLIQDILNLLRGHNFKEATEKISYLRGLGRNPDYCNSFDDGSFTKLVSLTAFFSLSEQSLKLSLTSNFVSLYATISNVLLLNTKLREGFTGRKELLNNTLDFVFFLSSVSMKVTPSVQSKIPPMRLLFLILFNGLDLDERLLSKCLSLFQYCVPKTNDYAIEKAEYIKDDPDGIVLCKETWKCCFTFLNNYKQYTIHFVQYIPQIIKAYVVVALNNPFSADVIAFLKCCCQLILCFDTTYFEIDKDSFGTLYKPLFYFTLKFIKAEIQTYELTEGSDIDSRDLLASFSLLIHITDMTDYELVDSEDKNLIGSSLNEQLRKLSVSSSVYNSDIQDLKDSRRSSITNEGSIFDSTPNLSCTKMNSSMEENSRIYDKIISKNALRSILVQNFIPGEQSDKKPHNPWFYDKCIELLQIPDLASLKSTIVLLFYKLSLPDDKIPNTENHILKFLKLVGFLQASAFLFSQSINIPDSIDVNSFLYPQYINEKRTHSRNQSITELPEMTEEEKEIEAERLFSIFERIKQNGILNVENPVSQWQREGRFENLD